MSTSTKSPPRYLVDGRVSIALDALDEKQKKIVGNAIANREHFLAITSDPRKVARLSASKPLYSLRLPSDLRIIYSQTGDDIVVMDLMMQSTLDWLGGKTKRRGKKMPRRSLRSKNGQ